MAIKPIIDTSVPIFRRNQNTCSSCGERNLPTPIVFARLSRLTNQYVCDDCYIQHNSTLSKRG